MMQLESFFRMIISQELSIRVEDDSKMAQAARNLENDQILTHRNFISFPFNSKYFFYNESD